jgi:hypothetical protein
MKHVVVSKERIKDSSKKTSVIELVTTCNGIIDAEELMVEMKHNQNVLSYKLSS